jgi:hypothetical protein
MITVLDIFLQNIKNMKTIEFDYINSKIEFKTTKFPSLLINLLDFHTKDANWALRLAGSSLQITLSCFDNSDKLLGEILHPLTPLVSPYQIQPYIFFNQFPIRFDINRLFINKQAISTYKVEIELLGIQFTAEEKYHLQFYLLEHTSYQIFCNRVTISTIFITDNHPLSPNHRHVTFIPVTSTTQSQNQKKLTFDNHQNYKVENNTSDEQIITDLFKSQKLICHSTWTKEKF